MISETRTKLISWLRSPKSLAAKAGLGVAAIAVVSAGTVSAFALTGSFSEPDAPQSNAITSEPTKKSQDTAVNEENTQSNDNTPAANVSGTTNPSTTPQQSGSTNTQSTPAAEPQQPAAPVYSDTYPEALKSAPISSKFDQWGLDNRQSTSYTAWKVNEAFGNMPKWGMTGNGNANNWPTLAANANIATGTEAKIHSVGVVGNFTVWVESVNGSNVTVSFYNWGNTGEYGIWENVPASKFSTYIYF
jgi:hypothetical protein